MLNKRFSNTLLILIIVLFTFSVAGGDDDLYCVSLNGFTKKNKLFRRIRGLNFHITDAEIYSILHTPPVDSFAVDKKRNWRGSYTGACQGGHGGFNLGFFFDDFVVIKKRPGVRLDKVKIMFSFTIEQYSINDKGVEIDDGEVAYHFTNKDLNIHRCKGKLY
ncbi:hypothetical protein [Candidatus Magnetominusculus xianensis]|uniref:Secreted protein n=1 Tax=Candidatus Magnetominusculus xianensis TaxID=1748249 RepID=A0ABR5SH45_9BACT|nr:hypothetical protein [Candidatus Magnetominusculus xianensis]KWT91015.1 hypothetical protein ASN18_0962 [Candidatus Magnetominusculus xianensis]MBF0402592.1 hypothetical protein [Nitrospirota bacterium]